MSAEHWHNKPLVNAISLGKAARGKRIEFDQPVYFVVVGLRNKWPELNEETSDIDLADVDHKRLLPQMTWLVSTYLRLRREGYDVRITDRLKPDHINVCYYHDVLSTPDAHGAFIVEVTADRDYYHWGDYAIEQSPVLAAGYRNRCLIDHWPQPDLIPRDPARGEEIRTVAYVGYAPNLADRFRTDEFRDGLADLGVEFVLKEDARQWRDYHDVDLMLAVRDISAWWLKTKPATKLVAAWLGGCVPLLGAEESYRCVGTPGENYFEAETPEDVYAAIRRLRDEPGLYRRMLAQGRELTKDHDEAAVIRQWASVLSGPIREAFERWRQAGPMRRGARRLGRAYARAWAPTSRKLFYAIARDLHDWRLGRFRRDRKK